MRVGVHLQALRPGSIGGVESYVRNLLDGMRRTDPDLQLVLFCADYNIGTFEGGPRVERQLLSASEFDRLEAGELIRRRLDLWFCPLLVLQPDDPGLPCVATMHDAQHERFPEHFEASILDWRRRTYPQTVARADRILTVSEFSRREILELLGAAPERVIVTPLDAGPGIERVTDENTLDALRRRHGLPDRFFYYPANPWPHKNHVALFEALARLKRLRDDVPGLVLTGAEVERADWGGALQRLGLESGVHAIGMVPEHDLSAVYTAATALVFPSRYEGFGIPLVEAMRAGCPVVCSRIGSLPEVAGDAAVYFDPEQPADIARALARLLDEPGLRESLAREGDDRARLYSWDETARRTLDVFRQVLAERGRPIRVGGPEPLPRITVVTPSYQQGMFIERTLRSVLDQSYPNLQHVVIDGGSTDDTTAILERYRQEYPGTLEYVSEADAGQADAVNKGLERADGKIIGWLNSDDTYEPGTLFRVAEAFLRHPEREFVYGRAYYIDGDDSRIGAYPTRSEFEWHELAHECFLCQPTVFLRRSVFDRGVRLDPRLKMCMDYDLWIRIGRECRPLFLDAYLANSRMHDANKTLSQRERAYDEGFDTVKRHYGYLPLSWAAGKAHYRCDGGHPLVRGRVSLRAAALAAWYLVSHNRGRPRYLAQVGRYAAGRLARRLRGPIS